MEIPFIDLGAMHRGLSVELDDAWARIRRTDAFIGGEAVERFEAEWADYCATDHCVGIANGTAAIELTLKAMDIGPGDEVIVPANTFIATAEAVMAAGARPVFVDVDPATLLMTAEGVQAMITGRTAAVVVVAGRLRPRGPRGARWTRTPCGSRRRRRAGRRPSAAPRRPRR